MYLGGVDPPWLEFLYLSLEGVFTFLAQIGTVVTLAPGPTGTLLRVLGG